MARREAAGERRVGWKVGLTSEAAQHEPLSGVVDAVRARRAVDLCHPALEVIEMRGDLAAQFALAIADNAQQKAFVLGDPVPIGDLNLRVIEARVGVNGAEVTRARGDAVGGDPLNSVVWLAKKLTEFDLALRPGDLIMTGSFTRQFSLAPGDRVRAEFDGLGTVEVGVAA